MTRNELYLAVWAEPVMRVAKRIGISDRGLAEVCRRVDIPTPPRGYWRRIQTGQTPDKTPLPHPGDDSVVPFTVEGALFMGIKAGKANTREAAGSAANTAPVEASPIAHGTRPSEPQRTEWVAGASPRTLATNPCVDVEYQKLMRYADQFERHQAAGRLLSELSLCLPSEAARVSTVLQQWLAMMRRQHAMASPVAMLLADFREVAMGEERPSWWTNI